MHSSNPFAYSKPITLDTLDDLFAHHHDRFGGWSMEGGGDGGDDGAGDGGGSGDDGKGGDGGDDKFTPITSQEDFNRRLSDRLRREREKFSDYDDLKNKASKYDKAVEEARSEQEKAVEEARREGETSALGKANERLVRSEARAIAAEAKFRNPQLAVGAIDLTGIKVNDDGSVDSAAIKTLLKELSDSEPYLVDDGKGKPRPDHSQGGDGRDNGPKTVKQVMEERRAAREAKK